MHSYRHQWSCQIVFGPRFLIGLGLTDGEGVERVWALLIGLIGMERRTGVSISVETSLVTHLIHRDNDVSGSLSDLSALSVVSIEMTWVTGYVGN